MNQQSHKEKRLEALQEYIARTRKILELSSPQLDQIRSAEDYRLALQHSFQKIGELGRENNAALQTWLFPLLSDEADLSTEDVESLHDFSALLIDTTNMENLDLPLLYLQAERILKNAEQSGDLRARIFAADSMVIASYMMLNLSIRLYPERDDCFRYRDEGLRAGKMLLSLLPPEQFAALPDDECRELVLINSRYIRCLFEWDDKEDKQAINEEDLRLMRQALALAEDPFYREQMPHYRWDLHVFRTLQYLSDFTEGNNKHRFSKEQLQEIRQYTTRLVELVDAHPELESGCPKVERDFYLARNGYLAGERSLEEYRNELLRIMKQRDPDDFSARGMFVSFTTPIEYLLTLDRDHLSAEQETALRQIYDDIAAYVYRMPKTGVLSFMITFLTDFLKHYIEVPGGMKFRDMCLQIIAAMHPPTYVHTLNVAAIARTLAERLLEREPQRFFGIAGARDVNTVRAKKQEILKFVHNSALLHDIGKLFIVETIMTYGRDLVRVEWEFIQAHTLMGAALLRRFPVTEEFAEIAMGHHLWYDGKGGYPQGLEISEEGYRTIISLVAVADCLDAATDTIGRSYKQGKSLEEYIEELRTGSGTRYAPFVVELFRDEDVLAEMQRMLTGGRDENYRNAYVLLKGLLEKKGALKDMAQNREQDDLHIRLQELQARFDFLLSAVDHLPNPIFMKDEDARFFFFNQAYSEFFGMRRRDYIGKTVLDLDYLPLEDRQRFQREDLKRIADNDIISYDTVFTTADGSDHPSFYWSRGFSDKVSGRHGLIGEIVDISKERALQKTLDESLAQLKEANEKLQIAAQTDHASGLYNRSVLWKTGQELMARPSGVFPRTCMVMIDLDNFKIINDRFGHLRGDRTLADIAGILRKECRPTDLPIRYGGDEFLVILNNIGLQDAIKVAERIRTRCEEEMPLPDGTSLTVSIGVIEINETEEFERNLSRLDQLLYKAKAEGRNRVVYEL